MTDRQKELLIQLEKHFGSKELVDKWLSTPNKLFRSKIPLDFLIQEHYDYFKQFTNEN